jgi:lipoate-protein ligase A
MAIDEAILTSVGGGESPPTLRVYAWTPACISLGFSQTADGIDFERLEALGWDLVRRLTGGRAIVHTDELTYSITAPAGNPHVPGDILASYRHLSQGLVRGLSNLGLQPEVLEEIKHPKEVRENPVCFEVPSSYEITAGGKKLVGSAQVRKKGAVLQHGSLPLGGDIARICDVLKFDDPSGREAAARRVRARATTVSDLTDEAVSWADAAQAIAGGFSEALGWELREATLSEGERRLAADLIARRYANPDWNLRV